MFITASYILQHGNFFLIFTSMDFPFLCFFIGAILNFYMSQLSFFVLTCFDDGSHVNVQSWNLIKIFQNNFLPQPLF